MTQATATGRSRRWPLRRLLGSVLGLVVVVGTGAVASASTHGGGFPAHWAKSAARPPNQVSGRGTGYHGGYATDSSRWGGPTWTWTGQGTNRWGFRNVADPKDLAFNQALGINNAGTIVGYSGSGKDTAHPNRGWLPASFPYTSFRDVNFPGSAQTQVAGINDEGTLAGLYAQRDGSNHGFVRWRGRYLSADWPHTTSKPSFSQLPGFSQNGIAAGFWNDAKGNSHGYAFNVRTHQFLPVTLPWGATSVTVTGVTKDGTAVGLAVVKKINDLNDRGWPVGFAEDDHGRTKGFVARQS